MPTVVGPPRDPLLQLIAREITQLLARQASVEGQLEGAEVHTEGTEINVHYQKRWVKVRVTDAKDSE